MLVSGAAKIGESLKIKKIFIVAYFGVYLTSQ